MFALILIAVAWFIGLRLLFTWPIMLLFGAVHSFYPVVPAFGFWQTLVVSLLISMLFTNPRANFTTSTSK